MSLKENINMVKDELNSEEKFFEKAVITEKFVKKYKNVMIGAVIAVVLLVMGNLIYEANKSASIEEANVALSALNQDPTNVDAKSELESLSKELFDVWSYSQAIANNDMKALKELSSSKTFVVADLASYELASSSADQDALSKYSMKQNSIYKDLALVQNAILFINKNEIEKAHQELKKVPQSSSLNKVVLALLHYGVK
ncbi:hypothetical protein [Sulfurimonas sp.]|uniref:hypothetical protein n=1 Tax=Sulfurimonas sp. TaxID=2022749 RepID=UPI003562DA81